MFITSAFIAMAGWSVVRATFTGRTRRRQAFLITAALATFGAVAIPLAMTNGYGAGEVVTEYTVPTGAFIGVLTAEVYAWMTRKMFLPPEPTPAAIRQS